MGDKNTACWKRTNSHSGPTPLYLIYLTLYDCHLYESCQCPPIDKFFYECYISFPFSDLYFYELRNLYPLPPLNTGRTVEQTSSATRCELPGYPLNTLNQTQDTWTDPSANPNPLAAQVFITRDIQPRTHREWTATPSTWITGTPRRIYLRANTDFKPVALWHTYAGDTGKTLVDGPLTRHLLKYTPSFESSTNPCKYIYIFRCLNINLTSIRTHRTHTLPDTRRMKHRPGR